MTYVYDDSEYQLSMGNMAGYYLTLPVRRATTASITT